MKNTTIASFVLGLVCTLPVAVQAQPRLSEDQLIKLATEQKVCGERSVVVVSYVNETDNKALATCSDATGFIPLIAGLGIGGASAATAAGAVAVALAAGGSGSTPDTQ